MPSSLSHVGFLIFFLLAFAWQHPATIVLSYIIIGIYGVVYGGKVKITNYAIGLCAFFMLMPLPAVLNFNFGGTSLVYLSLSPLLALAAHKLTNRPIAQVVQILGNYYWLISIIIFFVIAVKWEVNDPLEELIPGTSTNGIPAYLIVIQIAYSLAYFFKNKRLPILPCISTILIAIFGLGRSSMIVSTLMLLVSIFFNIASSSVDRDVTLKYFLAPASLLTAYIFSNSHEFLSVIDDLIEASKFSGGVTDVHRAIQIRDYLEKIDGWTLIFGSDFSGTSIVQFYGGNPHNSYIRLHSFYGLAGFLFIAIPIFYIFISKQCFINKAVTLSFMLLAFIRAGTEPIFFPTPLDLFYIIYIFIYYKFGSVKHVQ